MVCGPKRMGMVILRLIALLGGLIAGGANYALLYAGCKRFGSAPFWRSALLLFGGMLLPVIGLALCAVLRPAALVWFGCACAGILVLLAAGHMAWRLRQDRSPPPP